MNDTTQFDLKKASGSSDQWDDVWKEYSAEGNAMKKLFTREEPATIYQFWQRAYFEDFIEIIGEKTEGKRFLELGSGRGTTSLYLANHGVKDITLLDLSETALEQATRNFEFEALPVPKKVIANAEDTKLPSNSFDFIYNIGVLEHFEDPQPILSETFRLLKPSGTIFMPIVPQMPFYKSLTCRMFFNPISIAKHMAKKVLRRETKSTSGMVRTENGGKEYAHISSEVGFEKVQCIPYNPYWKVNEDKGFIFNTVALPVYKSHLKVKRFFRVTPNLKSFDFTSCCYLLTAIKPERQS